jgi:hypothetical protein
VIVTGSRVIVTGSRVIVTGSRVNGPFGQVRVPSLPSLFGALTSTEVERGAEIEITRQGKTVAESGAASLAAPLNRLIGETAI